MAAKTPWTLANDAQRCSHFSSECTHFEFEKLKWDKKLALGLKGEVTNCISHRKHWRKECLPLRARDLIPITKKMRLLLFELQRSCSSYPIPRKTDVSSFLQHKEFCCSDLLEMQEQTGRLKIGNSMHHPLSSFLSTAPLSVVFGTHAGKKYFPLIAWTSVLDQCTAFQELWDPKHV